MIVKRIWKKSVEVSQQNPILHVWDGGSRMLERRSDGSETLWEVLGRDVSEDGFTEILRRLPLWKSIGEVMWQGSNHAGWNIQEIVVDEVPQAPRPQAPRPQAPRPQAPRPQAAKPSSARHRHFAKKPEQI
jgi:hypothetical protein